MGTTEAMKQEQELQKKQDYKENQYLNSRMNIIIKETPYKIGWDTVKYKRYVYWSLPRAPDIYFEETF